MASISRGKLVQKLEKHPRPENLKSLKFKICNPEILSEMFQCKTRSKYMKTHKMQGAISKVTNASLELKNSKNLYIPNLSKNISTIGHDYTDSLVPQVM